MPAEALAKAGCFDKQSLRAIGQLGKAHKMTRPTQIDQAVAPPDRWASRRHRAIAFLREQGLGGLMRKIRAYGIRNSLAFLLMHLRYQICIELGKGWDRRHKVDTCGQIELENLDVAGHNKAEGHAVVSISPHTFAYLARFFPNDRQTFTYIDIGAGKGRSLLLASRYGFKKIIGVEFAGVVCDIARRNIESFKDASRANIDVVYADAADYELPPGNLVLYLNNPFGENVWKNFIANTEASLRKNPQKIIMIATGSVPEKIDMIVHRLASAPSSTLRQRGTAPYYLDTYLPFHYAVFETS